MKCGFPPYSHILLTLTLPVFLFCLSSCQEQVQNRENSCRSCHTMKLDRDHQTGCTTCHDGNSRSRKKDVAHFNMVRHPSHPDNMEKRCGGCHEDAVKDVRHSLHFTLKNSTNLFRQAFGAEIQLDSFLETPQHDKIKTTLDLADDLLRRRCFRCHPYSAGDNYPATHRGTGCAACHLKREDGRFSHVFSSPGDKNCLSCHYGNRVGADYYGRFEHDFNNEYRTPYRTDDPQPRPYGLEFHQLQPDIHQKRGLLCIDCHSGSSLMNVGEGRKITTCADCHWKTQLDEILPPRITRKDSGYFLLSATGKVHRIPLLENKAHFQNKTEEPNQIDGPPQPHDNPNSTKRPLIKKISCQVCHARWSFNDFGRHFLRSDTDDFDPWIFLTRQGSSEIEDILTNNTDYDREELPPEMADKINGRKKIGLWYKGYGMRRWQPVLLDRDKNGTLTTVRPALDYFLSWIDEEEKVRIDSQKANSKHNGLRPYTPHTTGAAGLFYKNRISTFLKNETRQQ
ncbi:hypothetical protein [Desulfomarina sp.]